MSSILRQVKLLYNARHCSTTNGANQLYDLVIVGGGMVGLALACAVGKFLLIILIKVIYNSIQ